MGDGRSGPIEDAFRQPVLKCRVAWRVWTGRPLGHVDDELGLRLQRRLGIVRGRLHKAGPHRIDEVGAFDPLERAPDDAEIEDIADEDFGAFGFELTGALVMLPNEGPDGEALL